MKISVFSDGVDNDDGLVRFTLKLENEDFKGGKEFYQYADCFQSFADQLMAFPFESKEAIIFEADGIRLTISLARSTGIIELNTQIEDDDSNSLLFSDFSIDTQKLHDFASSLRNADFSTATYLYWSNEDDTIVRDDSVEYFYKTMPLKSRYAKDVGDAFKEILLLVEDRSICFTDVMIDRGLAQEDKDRISVRFFHDNEEAMADREEYIQQAREEYISPKTESKIVSNEQLGYAEIYANYKDVSEIDSLELLLKAVIEYLETLKNDEIVQELKFVDHINDDALSEPHIEVFSIKNV